tara:strand:- start:54532 stop:55071 length:540 start_codon:yes stop_codon:yes gene_type:complete
MLNKGAEMSNRDNVKLSTRLKWFKWLPLIVLLDQASKLLVMQNLKLGDAIDIIPGLRLVLLHNYGVAFGMFNENALVSRLILLAVAVGISLFIGIWLYRTTVQEKAQGIGLVFILGGALGNIIDRVVQGYVVDFIDFYFKSWHFPAFNIADSFITIGAFFIILSIFKDEQQSKNDKASS